MNRVDTKKLYLGVYTTDGKHIPVRIITLIKTQDNKWKGCIRKSNISEKCDLDDVVFYTFNSKAIRRKSVRKNPDNIGFVITEYDMKDLTYDASSFHEYELKEVDNILMNDQSTESLIGDIVWRLRSLVLAKSILVVRCFNANMH